MIEREPSPVATMNACVDLYVHKFFAKLFSPNHHSVSFNLIELK